jgi:uncharacterized protein (DUF2062 family)
MLIPFCETEYQSIGIGVSVGIVSGIVAIMTNQLILGVLLGAVIAFGLEISLHEYRKDEQYMQAKERMSKIFKE